MAGTRPLIASRISAGLPPARSGPPEGGKPWQWMQMLWKIACPFGDVLRRGGQCPCERGDGGDTEYQEAHHVRRAPHRWL